MGGKMKQRKSEEKHRHTLGIFQSWGIDCAVCYPGSMRFLSSVEYILVLLPTGDVSSYRFPSGSGGFFCFLNSFQGPSQGSFQFWDDSSAFGRLPSLNSHIPACPTLVVQFPDNIPASHCPAGPPWIWVVVPVLQRCWDMKSIPCTPGSCCGISTASSLAMVLPAKASPKMMI